MTATPSLPAPPDGAAPPRRFDPVTIGLHWATAALIILMFASAWSLALARDPQEAARILTLHRSLGAMVWGLAVVRLVWRLTLAWLPPFPPAMSKLQQGAAKLSEYGLYALLLVQPTTGLGQGLARGRPFWLLAWEVPAAMARDRALTRLLHQFHAVTAWILLDVIALHIAAALFHRLVLKDSVLASMLPWPPSGIKPRRRRSGS